jgi:predicted anti-sigma-YlaC factor YlaD
VRRCPVICEEVRDRLPDHALGTLDETEDLRLRRHLRGCAQCRRELAAIGEGLTMFAAAAHDRRPPPELRERVLTTLTDEWRSEPVRVPEARRRAGGRIVAAAACVALLAALAWGFTAERRARDNAADARESAADAGSYRALLATLGGTEFRVGRLGAVADARIAGSVVLYDSSVEQSWGVVLVRAPDLEGSVTATLSGPEDAAMRLHDIELTDGAGSTWLVSPDDLHGYDRLTVRGADGQVVAVADIAPA